MKDENKRKEIKAKMAAFSDYNENGIEFVRAHYPEQIDFIEKNKDKDVNEVIDSLNNEFAAIVQQ